MRTVVEPQQHIAALWSKPEVKDGETFRMMRYVLRVDHESKVLLHNVVTGQLVVLDQDEAELVERLPLKYESSMKQLVDGHYLVPVEFDDHQRVVIMREILRKLDYSQRSRAITLYTILPTTSCNARCYYCFEQGVVPVTMSQSTAKEVVHFIRNHCEGKKINITWFGGEPTVASNRIDQISNGLRENGVEYQSDMITNGYLFDTEMVVKAKQQWHLRYVQISVDGTERNYNQTKAYVGIKGSAYHRVMNNIGLLLEQGIGVNLRMNFDLDNYTDFRSLVRECKERYPNSNLLQVYAYPVIGTYKNNTGVVNHGTDDWIDKTEADLNSISREMGTFHTRRKLPVIMFNGCEADNNSSITINAQGELVRCCEMFGQDQIVGNVREGITNISLYSSWNIVGDYEKCQDCTFFPTCVKMLNCTAKDRCYQLDRNEQFESAIKDVTNHWLEGQKKERGMQSVS